MKKNYLVKKNRGLHLLGDYSKCLCECKLMAIKYVRCTRAKQRGPSSKMVVSNIVYDLSVSMQCF